MPIEYKGRVWYSVNMRRRRRSRVMVNPITLDGYYQFSLLKAAIVIDANGQTLAEFLNPEDRPARGRAMGDPSWTDDT